MGSGMDMGNMMESFEELFGMDILQMFASEIPSTLINLAVYIFTGLGLYTIAKRRGIHNPWLAWVPFANAWLLGCISDHYRHVVRQEVKSRRKVLLGTEIAVSAIAMVILGLCIVILFSVLGVGLQNLENMSEAMADEFLSAILGPAVVMLLLCLPLLVVAIVHTVFYLIAMHDIYKSCDPANATLYLVLGIFFSFLVPVFLMICRNKDAGMVPPQPVYYQPPVYQPPVYQQPMYHPVNNEQPVYQLPTDTPEEENN